MLRDGPLHDLTPVGHTFALSVWEFRFRVQGLGFRVKGLGV